MNGVNVNTFTTNAGTGANTITGTAATRSTGGTVYQSGYWHADFHQTQTDCFPFYYALQAQETNDSNYPLLCPAKYKQPAFDVLIPDSSANTNTH